MARVRRKKRRKQSRSLAVTQILMLTGILVMMLVFRKHIGVTMSTLLSSFGGPSSDVNVTKEVPGTPASDAPVKP